MCNCNLLILTDRWRTRDYDNVINSVEIMFCNCSVVQRLINGEKSENVSNILEWGVLQEQATTLQS